MATQLKYIRKSDKYKYVFLYETKDKKQRWGAMIYSNGVYFDTEREAAISIDKKLISKGKKPINILIPKLCAV